MSCLNVNLKGSACVSDIGCWTGLQDLTNSDLQSPSYTIRTLSDPHPSSADHLISQQGQVGRMIDCGFWVPGGIY